jgi:hypothetical protein
MPTAPAYVSERGRRRKLNGIRGLKTADTAKERPTHRRAGSWPDYAILPPTSAVERHGVALFGGVQVETRLPGKQFGGHQYHRREDPGVMRRERRTIRSERRAPRGKMKELRPSKPR